MNIRCDNNLDVISYTSTSLRIYVSQAASTITTEHGELEVEGKLAEESLVRVLYQQEKFHYLINSMKKPNPSMLY